MTAKKILLASLLAVACATGASARDSVERGSAASVGGSMGAVRVVAESTGHLLVASGKVLAFIPNELGRALLHHSRY